ncbi:MFS transporter [Candidatus Omnitrophota bacterium]
MKKSTWCILLFCAFACMLGLGIISPLLPVLAKQFNANGFWIGMIFTGFVISRGIFMPIVGRLSDKFGRKVFITSGLLLYTFISLLYIFARGIYSLTSVRLLHGVACGMIFPIVMSYAADFAEKGKEGKTMGLLTMMFYLGMAAGPLFGGFLSNAFGFRSVFYIMALLSGVAFLVALVFMPEAKKIKKGSQEAFLPFRTLIRYNIIKAILLISAIITLRGAVLMSFLPSLAAKANIDPSRIGLIISLNVIFAGTLQAPFGKIADRLDWHGQLYQIIIGCVIGATAIFLIPLFPVFWFILAAAITEGIVTAVSTPPALILSIGIGQRAGMGSWMGIFNTAMGLGLIIAPLASGIIMDWLGINAVFYIFGIVSYAGTIIGSYYIWKRFRGRKK